MTQNFRKSELLSDEVQQIISYQPHWIIRKGGLIYFIVVIFLLALTWIIQYPDSVPGTVRIVSTVSPKLVISKADGKIEKLFVENNAGVVQGQTLVFIQSTADHAQVLQLQQWINDTERGDATKELPELNQLGDIQPHFELLKAAAVELKAVSGSGYYRKKSESIVLDIENVKRIEKHLLTQKQIAEQDYQLQTIEYNAKEKLLREKVIAPLEFNQDKSKLMAKQQVIGQMDAQLVANRAHELNKRKELLDLEKTMADKKQAFNRELFNLKSKVAEWLQQYVIFAPESGRLMFVRSFQQNQHIGLGEEMFNVQSEGVKYYAEMFVGQKNFGKIKQGQKVTIDADGYPSAEYGFLEGSIAEIANIPARNDSFLIRLALPKGLTTSFGKNIQFRNNLSAKGNITTKNRRLMEKFFGQLRQIFSDD